MPRLPYIVLLLVSLASCRDGKNESKTHILEFDSFTVEVPREWKKLKDVQGVDAKSSFVAIDSKDTVEIVEGCCISSLTEPEPHAFTRRQFGYDLSHVDTTDMILMDDNDDIDSVRKQNVQWDTIDGHKAKIVFPRVAGRGVTGVFFRTVKGSYGEVRLNLHGENLSAENEQQVLESIKTMKFKNK